MPQAGTAGWDADLDYELHRLTKAGLAKWAGKFDEILLHMPVRVGILASPQAHQLHWLLHLGKTCVLRVPDEFICHLTRFSIPR